MKPKADLRIVKPDKMAACEPLFLSTVALLDEHWSEVAALFEPLFVDDMYGEMTIGDMYQAIVGGRMYCLVFKSETNITLALVMELVVYPRKTIMNIVAVGGSQLDLMESRFWKHICSWAYMNGVREMQAMVSPAMARIIGKYGFAHVYNVVRLPLTEM